jgi:hypothetical protein
MCLQDGTPRSLCLSPHYQLEKSLRPYMTNTILGSYYVTSNLYFLKIWNVKVVKNKFCKHTSYSDTWQIAYHGWTQCGGWWHVRGVGKRRSPRSTRRAFWSWLLRCTTARGGLKRCREKRLRLDGDTDVAGAVSFSSDIQHQQRLAAELLKMLWPCGLAHAQPCALQIVGIRTLDPSAWLHH